MIDDNYSNYGIYTLKVDDSEIDNCDSIDEVMELIKEYVIEDFIQNIIWY